MLPVVKDLTSTARFLASGLLMMAMLSAVAALSGHACPGRLTVTSTRTFTAYPFGSAATTDTANNLLPLATSIAGIYTDYSSSNQPEGPGGYQNAYPTTGPVDSGQTQEQGEAGRQEISETTAKADPPAFGIEVTKPWSPTTRDAPEAPAGKGKVDQKTVVKELFTTVFEDKTVYEDEIVTTNTRESYTTPGKNNGHAGAEVFNHEGGQGKDGHTEVAGDQEASPPSPTPVPKPGAPYPSVTTVTSHVTITVDPPAGPGGAPGKGTLLNPAEFPTVTAKTRQEDNDRASPQTSESSVSIPAVVTAPPLKVTNAAETTSTGASPAPTANNPYPTATKTTSNITAGVEPLHAGGGGSADKQTIVQSSDGPLVTIYFQASDAWPSIGPMDPLSAKDGSGGKGTLANTADGAPVTVYFNGPDVWPSIGPIKWNIGSNSTPGTTFKIDDPALGKHKSPTKTTTTTKTTAKDGTVKTAHTHAAPVKDNLDEFVSTGSLTDTNTYKPLPPGTTTDTHTTAWMLEPTGKKTTTTKQATTTSSSSTTSTSPTAAGKETKNQPGTPAFAALPTIFDPDATYTTDT